MSYKLIAKTGNPPVGALMLTGLMREEKKTNIEVNWSGDLKNCSNVQLMTKDGSSVIGNSENEIARFFARNVDESLYGGADPLERTEVDSWLSFAIGHVTATTLSETTLNYLNSALALKTWLVANHLTIADIRVFSALYYKRDAVSEDVYPNIVRWIKHMEAQPSFAKIAGLVSRETNNLPDNTTKVNKKECVVKRKQEGNFIDLPGAEMGKMVVRFPPEASGYLHIGHAKAALLNQYYAEAFKGKLIMRFDDTNPAKENVEFEKAILQDLEMLEIKADVFSHSSDHFELMLKYCDQLIRDGKAFVDDTPAETMKEQREQKLPSANRERSISENLRMWQEMKLGTVLGQKCCVRAKIDYQSANGCMRDPTIYRCKCEPHPKTGTKYKVYPTYDFACPIVDAIEGVTHTLRTTEYHDRDAQFYWFIEALGLNRPYIWAYSRLNMTHTVLSKRKLTWFVSEGLVDGWDDPRFPTVRGILRRGMTVAGLKEFIIAQGSSKSVVFMEWDKIWAFNKKVIDPVAVRYTAIGVDKVPVTVLNAKAEWLSVQKHPKNKAIGMKEVLVGPSVQIEREDANILKINENATFINWGNLLIKNIERKDGKIVSVSAVTNLDDKNFKNTPKISWICSPDQINEQDRQLIPCVTTYFDHIISKAVLGKDDDFKDFVAKNTRREEMMVGECEMSRVKKGEIIQILRKGFFRCDVPFAPTSSFSGREQPLVLFHIPDGHSSAPTTDASEDKCTTESKSINKSVSNSKAIEIHEKIINQGNKIRDLKSKKVDKSTIEPEVKALLALKGEFKTLTGSDWTPSVNFKAEAAVSPSQLSEKIIEQGNKVRELKSKKADKTSIETQLQTLLTLKAEYKMLTGNDWKPEAPAAGKMKTEELQSGDASKLCQRITEQGNKVRELKSNKSDKATIDAEVKSLLALKAEFKKLTGNEWKPSASGNSSDASTPTIRTELGAEQQSDKIVKQGDKIRKLKSDKANKATIDAEVKVLLALKAEYKSLTGSDWAPTAVTSSLTRSTKEKGAEKKMTPKIGKKEQADKKELDINTKTGTRLGLEVKKTENLADWYSQVITKGEMIEYYDVSGCYVLRPWSFTIWESIKDFFDREIKKLGVQNCYFPIFVSRSALEREKEHIADFAPEVAWVTKSGDSDLSEHIAIRPTSETVMYPAYAKWIKSHRDLPLKLNQWNNVVRWEFKHPQPFLRTREFLWQEGHTAFATKTEADEEVLQILDLYRRIYEEFLAIPVVPGRKSEKEKFAGGDYTTTVEAFVSASGRGIQGATSHHLGQNFSKMFDIQIDGETTGDKTYVYQNSWGLTTRTIGVMIMVHGDDKGLVLPPKVAALQVIIVPCGITATTSQQQRDALMMECAKLEQELKADQELRVKADYRDNYSPGWKFNHWELKGVPVRLELGPKDLAKNQITLVRRDNGERLTTPRKDASSAINRLLVQIQNNLFNKAKTDLDEHIKIAKNWDNFCDQLENKCLLLAPFCGDTNCEDNIKRDSARKDATDPTAPSMGAKSLCIPFKQPENVPKVDTLKCIHTECNKKPLNYVLFGRSY